MQKDHVTTPDADIDQFPPAQYDDEDEDTFEFAVGGLVFSGGSRPQSTTTTPTTSGNSVVARQTSLANGSVTNSTAKPTRTRPTLAKLSAARSVDSSGHYFNHASPMAILKSYPLHSELRCVVEFFQKPNEATTARRRRSSSFSYEQLLADGLETDDDSKLTLTLSNAGPVVKDNVEILKDATSTFEERCMALDELLYLIEQAWSMPVVGRDVAYHLSDILRVEGGVDALMTNLGNEEGLIGKQAYVIILMSALVLSQAMTVPNREYIARQPRGLEMLLRAAYTAVKDNRLLRPMTEILGCLFKESEETCRQMVARKGLEIIIYACRSFDYRILRNCSGALANIAMYGTSETQREMAAHKVLDWLFPLAFSGDDVVSYYALIAITALAANVELEAAAVRSGTLKLVEPFVSQHDPEKFGFSDKEHCQGHSENWLRRLVPLLSSRCLEARIIASFHFVIEAAIHKSQGKIDVFKTIGAITPLKKVVISKVKLASKFAAQALNIMDETVPRVLSPRVPLWTTEDVSCWIHQIRTGGDLTQSVEELLVDGDLLLLLTETNVKDDLGVTNGITKNRLMRELNKLRQSADYSSCDRTGLAGWLSSVSSELRQYTYQMLKCGITVQLLPQLAEHHLHKDCGIQNGVHRLMILEAAKRISASSLSHSISIVSIPESPEPQLLPGQGLSSASTIKYDVFISYRRSNGQHLAGLLKVYLMQKGLNVYLDIESLRIGRFDENLIKSIYRSKNFLLLLTANSLDRCMGDDRGHDWIHKEILAALRGDCKIIPLATENFVFPTEESLPEDIRSIVKYHAIPWNNFYQEACITNLVKIITEPDSVADLFPPKTA